VPDKKYLALVGEELYVGVVKVSLVREGAVVVCDGHGRRNVFSCCAGSKGGIGMGQW
jgi:hypothetical protein